MTANASISPESGLVLVDIGIFSHLNIDDNELAAVLAHEIAHVLANHLNEDRSWTYMANAVSLPFVPFELLGQYVAPALILAFPLVAVRSFMAFLSRKREKEADYIGMMLMVDAGFDPAATVSVWRKWKEIEDRELSVNPWLLQTPQWKSTRPHVSWIVTQIADSPGADQSAIQSSSRMCETERWIPEILDILGKQPSATDAVAAPSTALTAKRRRWEEFRKKRDESHSEN